MLSIYQQEVSTNKSWLVEVQVKITALKSSYIAPTQSNTSPDPIFSKADIPGPSLSPPTADTACVSFWPQS